MWAAPVRQGKPAFSVLANAVDGGIANASTRELTVLSSFELFGFFYANFFQFFKFLRNMPLKENKFNVKSVVLLLLAGPNH